MIPTVIVFGLLLGRWWWAALPLATAGWPILLMSVGDISVGQIPVAAFLGFANAAVGVVVAQSILWTYRRLRRAESLQRFWTRS